MPEYTIHDSPNIPDQKLWVAKDFGTYRLLTDGEFYYIEAPDGRSIRQLDSTVSGAEIAKVSPIDQFFMGLKETVKQLAIDFIKSHPNCLLMDVIGYLEAQKDKTHADLGKVLLEAYGRAGVALGLFSFQEDADEDQKFEVLRDFIVNTSDEDLQTLLS